MIRAAIVGLGSWGKTLVGSVQGPHNHSDDIRFTTACTRTPANAQDYCREHGMQLTANYESILADRDIDAVVLATPNSLHESQITQAAAAGKHIYVEKPFTLTLASARAAVAAVTRAEVTLAVGLNRRFHPNRTTPDWLPCCSAWTFVWAATANCSDRRGRPRSGLTFAGFLFGDKRARGLQSACLRCMPGFIFP